jgi:methionyl-tRNA synthetase
MARGHGRAARDEGITPKSWSPAAMRAHAGFCRFEIRFDNYYSTNSRKTEPSATASIKHAAERGVSPASWRSLLRADAMFMPDRFVKGTARNAAPRTSTAIPATHAARPTRRRAEDARCTLCGQTR